MIRFVVSRLIKALLMLIGVLILNFLLIRLVPGDPATIMAGESGMSDPAFVNSIRAAYGLDQPLLVQLKTYMAHVLSGDLGFSYRLQSEVSTLILERLPATIALTGSAFVLSMLAGVSLGALAGYRMGSVFDRIANLLAVLLYSIPVFWLGLMLILIFSVVLRLLPASGTGYEYGDDIGWAKAISHLVMPALTLAAFYVAVYFRLGRTSVSNVLHLDFVRTARSKGLTNGSILWRHVVPNAILPILTMAALQAGHLVSGSIAVETIFAWPGVGRLGYEALMQRDYNMLLAVLLTTSAMVLLFNFIADVLYAVVDPRINLVK